MWQLHAAMATAGCLLVLFTMDVAEGRSKKDLRNGNVTKRIRHRDLREGVCELELQCKGGAMPEDLSMPVRLPVRGPRGSQGLSGEDGESGQNGMPGIPGLPGLSAPVSKKVAFFVGLTDNLGPVNEHTDILFDRVVTNIGSGYEASSGRFTAPVNGTYQFNVIVSAQGRQKAAVMVLKNGGMVATVWAESIPYWATASNIAILSMEKGDQVWLMLLNRASYLHGYMYTTFSGFMIFEN